MMTSSNGNIFRVPGPLLGNLPVTGEFTYKGQWHGALMFSLICVWTNDWANNRDASDLIRQCAHCDVTGMVNLSLCFLLSTWIYSYIVVLNKKMHPFLNPWGYSSNVNIYIYEKPGTNAFHTFKHHYNEVTMGSIAFRITSLTIVYSFIRAQIKENIKAVRHWPLCGEVTGNRWIPRTNGQLRGKCFHLMTSSCFQ